MFRQQQIGIIKVMLDMMEANLLGSLTWLVLPNFYGSYIFATLQMAVPWALGITWKKSKLGLLILYMVK